MDYDAETNFGGDPRLRFYFARLGKLPEATRNLIIRIIEVVIEVNGWDSEDTS